MYINTNFNNQIAKTTFGAKQNVSNPYEPKEKDSFSIGTKYLLPSTLLILGIAGVCMVAKGRMKGKIKPELPSGAQKNSNPFDGIEDIKFDEKELTLEAFKKEGKFNKGKALINGKDYTGTITTTCPSDGSKVVMEYFYGDLHKSTKIAKDGTNVFSKEYFYLDNEEKLSHCLIEKNGKEEMINFIEKRANAKKQ